ncbi:MAG: NUDIX domain-containing protein [Patescibacteria group bacterium]
MADILNIVDENDQVIGQESREEIHRRGLVHREIHVYFLTPNGEMIFQHRAKDKDTFPDLLDVAVGGHVEIGESYIAAAVKETEEETGLKLAPAELKLIDKVREDTFDPATGKLNRVFNACYVYVYAGALSALRLEAGKALGFVAYPLDRLSKLADEEKSRFIPAVLNYVSRIDWSLWLNKNTI